MRMANNCSICLHYDDLWWNPPICHMHKFTMFFDDTQDAKDCEKFNPRYDIEESEE